METKLHPIKQKLKRLMPHHVKDNTGRLRKIEDEELRKLHAKGLNDKQIAEKIGCSKTTVRIRRNKLGLPINNPIPKGGYTRKVYDDTIRKIIEMNASGCNDAQIAKALQLDDRTVWLWRNKKLGLPTNTNTNSKFGTFKTMQKDGLTDKQIAEALGVKVSTVGCWRFRLKAVAS